MGEHSHTHGDGVHEHTHAHPVEDYAARKHPEFVVLDIGEGVGALILHCEPAMHGLEIEISPEANDDSRSHKQVLERSAGGRSEYTAVYDGLPAGTYTLWLEDGPRRGIVIEGGSVAQLDWQAAGARSD